jgi:hypothetical protein
MNPKVLALNPEIRSENPLVSAPNPQKMMIYPRVYNPRQNVHRIKPNKTKNPALQRERGFDKTYKD